MQPLSSPSRLGILLSGRGSNFEAIARAVAEGRLHATIAVVISNRPAAPGLVRARELGLPAIAEPPAGRPRDDYDAALVALLREHGVDLVCLAGFMRLLSPTFVQAFPQRILNIHPSLLPAFPGLEAQTQALAAGVRFSGCTVHFVDESLDGGPIISQAIVPVQDADDVETLAERILREEHRLYPEAIALVLSGHYRLAGRRVLRLASGG
ncbi:MAG: phosphoribosylglycinamide formyltransferase [Terriglobales bacterium]